MKVSYCPNIYTVAMMLSINGLFSNWCWLSTRVMWCDIFPMYLFFHHYYSQKGSISHPSKNNYKKAILFDSHQVVTRLTALVDSRFWDPFTILSTYFNIISRNILRIPLSILTYSDILNQARSDLKRLKCKWTRKVVDKIPLIVRLQNPLKKEIANVKLCMQEM